MYFCSFDELLLLLILWFGLWTKSEGRWPPLLFGLNHCVLPACVQIAHGVWKAGLRLALPTVFVVPCLYNPITKQVLEPDFSLVAGYFSWFGGTVRFLFRRFIICQIPSIKGFVNCCNCYLGYFTVSWVVPLALGGWYFRQVKLFFTSVSHYILYYILAL